MTLVVRELLEKCTSVDHFAHVVITGCYRYVSQALAQPAKWLVHVWRNWWRATGWNPHRRRDRLPGQVYLGIPGPMHYMQSEGRPHYEKMPPSDRPPVPTPL
ncbi:hypothetical protein ElyMa_003423200 [Elysia marginata]|uniref:Uncharacterized protein n=1 Tax=Elysia marginata TaxID=1093978 RepID=A0AAV4JSP0_9GAST|nr:hypothetical protein ElyMa_003423200 [Elysia marginata]